MEKRELVIIGAGPAGLTAAIYGKRAGLDVLLIEKGVPGGQINITEEIENWPGVLHATGPELGQMFRAHAEKFNTEFRDADVQRIELRDDKKIVVTAKGEVEAEAVIIATGAFFRRLGCEGEAEHIGQGVSYCAVCDGAFFEGEEIAVVGGGNSAVEEGEYLTNFASKVYIIHRRDEFRADRAAIERALSNPKIVPVWNSVVQSIEGNLAFVHGGPFANIAHGCNSVAATRAAMKLGDYAITEAGFGSDLGAEKFYNIKCRAAGLNPAAVVLVTSTKALKWHGGVPLPEIGKPNAEALKKGLCNLDAHVENLKRFGPNIVVSINHFHTDLDEELDIIRNRCAELGVRVALSDGFALGGKGAVDVARAVIEAAEDVHPLNFTYEADAPVMEKVEKIAKTIYGAAAVELAPAAAKDLKRLQDLGFDRLPVCIAKTPFSFSHDPKLLGAPKGFTLPVQRLILNAGAGFVVVTTGAIMRMPGLPKVPAAMSIDVKDGKITGLA